MIFRTVCRFVVTFSHNLRIPHSASLHSVFHSIHYDSFFLKRKKIVISLGKFIVSYNFKKMKNSQTLIIPEGITEIKDSEFYQREDITSVVIPDSVTKIDTYAFSECKHLLEITIPDSVTEIGYGAFDGCSELKSIHIPCSLTKIAPGTFWECTGLTSVTIPESVNGANGHFAG